MKVIKNNRPDLETIEIDDTMYIVSFPKNCRNLNMGWGNGYVRIPSNNKYYRCSMELLNELIDVEGGITYAEMEGEFWVVGFGTALYWHSILSWPKSRVIKETKNLKKQLLGK